MIYASVTKNTANRGSTQKSLDSRTSSSRRNWEGHSLIRWPSRQNSPRLWQWSSLIRTLQSLTEINSSSTKRQMCHSWMQTWATQWKSSIKWASLWLMLPNMHESGSIRLGDAGMNAPCNRKMASNNSQIDPNYDFVCCFCGLIIWLLILFSFWFKNKLLKVLITEILLIELVKGC